MIEPSDQDPPPLNAPPAPPPPLPVLNYTSKGSIPHERPAGEVSPAQVAVTAVIAAPILVVLTFFGILCIALASAELGWVIIVGEVLAVNWWAFSLRKSERYRGVAMGLWIGFGVAALIEGACFGLAVLK